MSWEQIMSRRKSSILEDMMEIAAHLPWQAGVGLAVVAYFVFHYFATQAPLTTNPVELKAMGKTLGDSMVHGVWTTIAGILQHVVPLAFLSVRACLQCAAAVAGSSQ